MTRNDRVEAIVTRMGETGTFCFAVDDWGRSYFVHRKNVSEIGEKGWDWIAACVGDYVVRVEGIPIDQGRGQWTLIEAKVL